MKNKASAVSLACGTKRPGLSIGNREPAMGLRGIPEAEVIMQDMEVGEDALVMPPRGFAKGLRT